MIPKPKKELIPLKKYQPPLKERQGKIRLDFNENVLGPSPCVRKALKSITNETLSSYPDASQIKEKLAQFLRIEEENIVLTNGTDEGIFITIFSYLEKGTEIIIPTPTFCLYELYAKSVGARIKKIPYNADFSFPTNQLLESINNKTKIIVLVNPNNPTGTLIPEEDIRLIVGKANKYGSLVILDEAYWHYCRQTNYLLIKEYENLVIFQTFSKAYGLAGIRLGYVLGAKEIIATLEKTRPPYTINAIAIIAALAALEDQEYVKKYVDEINKTKEMLFSACKSLNFIPYKTGANFFLLKVGQHVKRIREKLKQRGILLRELQPHPLLKGYIRVGIGTKKQTKMMVEELMELKYVKNRNYRIK